MNVSIRLAEVLRSKVNFERRGFLNRMAKDSGVERHTLSALIHNKATYVSLATLSKVCDYLVKEHGCDPDDLPGRLFGRDPEPFWSMLAKCQKLNFILGARTFKEWPAKYVIATDSRLEAVLLSTLSRFDISSDAVTSHENSRGANDVPHFYPEFRIVSAPPGSVKSGEQDSEWAGVRQEAEEVYQRLAKISGKSALVAIGSVKVNPIVELIFSNLFSTTFFQCEDSVSSPKRRSCPIFFRYRDADPQPPSCIGGIQLAKTKKPAQAGIYFENEEGKWECVPCDESHDAAFVLYAYRPNLGSVQVACGGFSSVATALLANQLETVASHLGKPQYESHDLKVGLCVAGFRFDPADPLATTAKPGELTIHQVGETALKRRLAKRGSGATDRTRAVT